MDWTSIRRGKNKLSAFVGTLGYSRFSFVWFADNEKFETLIDCHERFLDAIDGVLRIPEHPAGHSDDIRAPRPGYPATFGASS